MVVISDAAHANLPDGYSSAGRHLVLLVGEQKKCYTLTWSCNEIKRVVKLTLAAKLLSLSEAVDHAIYLRHIISELTSISEEQLTIGAYAVNKSVVEALHSMKPVEDERLRIDIGALKETMQAGKLKWIR